jgi:hypothetical protein
LNAISRPALLERDDERLGEGSDVFVLWVGYDSKTRLANCF